jgi:hypothetical protein
VNIRKSKISPNSLVEKYLPASYKEAYEIIVTKNNKLTPDNLFISFWTDFPVWVRLLFWLRDILVKPLGLKGSDRTDHSTFKKNFTRMVKTSGSYKMINILAKSDNETVIQLTDKHLTAELSCCAENITDEYMKIKIITLVHYHNVSGKIYFNIIKPFHIIILKTVLKRSVKIILSMSRLRQNPIH